MKKVHCYRVFLKTPKGVETADEFLDKKLTKDALEELYSLLKETNSGLDGMMCYYLGEVIPPSDEEILTAGLTEDKKDV